MTISSEKERIIMVHNIFVAKYYWHKEQGDLFKKAVKEKKTTYAKLATLLGYPSRQSVFDIARARTGLMDSALLEKICTELEVDFSYFYPSVSIDKNLFTNL
jgi:transcriptional regulator with XRE-family HTH domain